MDITTPDEDVFIITPLGTYTVFSGTSMATLHVAGVASLLLSHEPTVVKLNTTQSSN